MKDNKDIFLWANQTDAVKNELTIELFLFNKLYTPFAMRFGSELEQSIRATFLYDVINSVNLGAGVGLAVRDYELSESEENVLLHTELEKVDRAAKLINMVETLRDEIVDFSEDEHEFKRMKGMLLRCTRPDGEVFYVTKAIQTSSVLKGSLSWELNGGAFNRFKSDIGVRPALDNQVIVIGNDIFIFNVTKFEKLFEYEYKTQLLASSKVEELMKNYKLSFPEGLDLQYMIRNKPSTARKLLTINIGEVSQEAVIDYADKVQLDLMTDDQNRIIIMDGRDLDMFVNLINEDYALSEITGKRYLIKNKRQLNEEDSQMRLV